MHSTNIINKLFGLVLAIGIAVPAFAQYGGSRPVGEDPSSIDEADERRLENEGNPFGAPTSQPDEKEEDDFDIRLDLSMDSLRDRHLVSANPELLFKAGPAKGNLGGTFDLGLQLPLEELQDDWQIKFGESGARVNQVSLRGIASSNADWHPVDREWDAIALTTADIEMGLHVGGNTQIGLAGTLVWFPIEGEAGIAGFGVGTSLIGPEADALFSASAIFEERFAGWDLTLSDHFDIRDSRLQSELGQSYFATLDNLADEEFDQRRLGNDRTLQSPRGQRRTGSLDSELTRDGNQRILNTARFSASRMFGQNAVLLHASRRDEWQSRGRAGGGAGGDDHRWREALGAIVQSVRPSLRFKPFASYLALRSDDGENNNIGAGNGGIFDAQDSDDFSHTVRVGVDGPVTENMSLHADAGYSWTDQSNGTVWRFELTHTPRHSVWHRLGIAREVGDRSASDIPGTDNALTDRVYYQLRYQLGPRIVSTTLADWRDYVDIDVQEWSVATKLTFDTGPHSELTMAALYSEEFLNGSLFNREVTWSNTFRHDLGPRADLVLRADYSDNDGIGARRENYMLGGIGVEYDLSVDSTLSLEYEYYWEKDRAGVRRFEHVVSAAYTRKF